MDLSQKSYTVMLGLYLKKLKLRRDDERYYIMGHSAIYGPMRFVELLSFVVYVLSFELCICTLLVSFSVHVMYVRVCMYVYISLINKNGARRKRKNRLGR